MNIFCVGRNYVAHAEELNNDVPSSPLIFMKPESSLLQGESVNFPYPNFSESIHYEGEIVLRLDAMQNIEAVSFGIDFTARDLQSKLKSNGHPWELAKAFRNSCCLGTLLPYNPHNDIHIQTLRNGVSVQEATSDLLIFDFQTIINYLKTYFSLSEGDLIFTGTPAGVGEVKPGDTLEGYINNNKLLTCRIS